MRHLVSLSKDDYIIVIGCYGGCWNDIQLEHIRRFQYVQMKEHRNIPMIPIYLFIGKLYFTHSSSIVIIGVESLSASWLYCVSLARAGAVIAGHLVLENGPGLPPQTIYELRIEILWKFFLLSFRF